MSTGRLYLFRKRVRLTRRLHSEWPFNGWKYAWRISGSIQRESVEVLVQMRQENAEAELFERSVLADIDRLPELA